MKNNTDTPKICPFLGTCYEKKCEWWIEGYGITPGCAITKMARDHVIASQFQPVVENAVNGFWESHQPDNKNE
jgi:hypothetical protein